MGSIVAADSVLPGGLLFDRAPDESLCVVRASDGAALFVFDPADAVFCDHVAACLRVVDGDAAAAVDLLVSTADTLPDVSGRPCEASVHEMSGFDGLAGVPRVAFRHGGWDDWFL